MLKRIKYKRFVLLGLLVLMVMAFAVTQEFYVVTVGETRTYFVDKHESSIYYWQVFNDPDFMIPAPASEAHFPGGNTRHSVDIEWRKEGLYYIAVAEYDLNGCMNIKAKAVKVNPGGFIVRAGNDTIIGQCQPLQLNAYVEEQEGLSYTYQWEPAENLDDPESATPVFTPGSSKRYTVTVTNSNNITATGTVQVTVSDVKADAGPDAFIYSGETAQLNGSNSRGEGLEYFWTTPDGTILSGRETANPVVGGDGSYMLRITDRFGCEDYDTVTVSRLTREPVVFGDSDTTEFREAVKIYILENDHDPDNVLDPALLKISVPPMHGTATVDFSDNTIIYTPQRNFSGTDDFNYRICELTGKWHEASVFVMVKDLRFVIPEAFSPNSDGINDYFEIPGIEYYEGNSIEIFNRWGSRVYNTKNYGINASPLFWDGKSHKGIRPGNDLLPAGTYFYLLDLGNGEKPIAGTVYLKR